MKRTTLYLLLPLVGALPAAAQSIPAYAIPASKHYRESGIGNATGRSGGAHMTARALLGADGNTTVELTTADLDSATTPPGSFRKVQLKPLDPNGNAMFTQNITPLDTSAGYYNFTWPSLQRHEQIQLQGNIAGLDNRTDVVTLVETVKLRPDLAIRNFRLPDSAIVNTPVVIPANVVELNGDASATTTCQLAIDGAIVDQARNIFVDAGGSVSCAFSYTFTATGNHTVQVTASNVIPADWDTSNNSASTNINIIPPPNDNTAEHGAATFSDQTGGFPLAQSYSKQVWQNGGTVYNYSQTTGTTGEVQNTYLLLYSGACAAATNATAYQFPVNVAYAEAMDGTQVYATKLTGITSTSTPQPTSGAMCGSTVASFLQQNSEGDADGISIHVSATVYYDSASNPISAYQQVDATRNAGDVTYLSSGYSCQWFQSCDNTATYYTWNTNTQQLLGTVVPVGSTWTPSLTVTDASGAGFGGSIAVSLTSTPITGGRPNTCRDTGPDQWGYTYHICTSSQTNYTDTEGSASY